MSLLLRGYCRARPALYYRRPLGAPLSPLSPLARCGPRTACRLRPLSSSPFVAPPLSLDHSETSASETSADTSPPASETSAGASDTSADTSPRHLEHEAHIALRHYENLTGYPVPYPPLPPPGIPLVRYLYGDQYDLPASRRVPDDDLPPPPHLSLLPPGPLDDAAAARSAPAYQAAMEGIDRVILGYAAVSVPHGADAPVRRVGAHGRISSAGRMWSGTSRWQEEVGTSSNADSPPRRRGAPPPAARAERWLTVLEHLFLRRLVELAGRPPDDYDDDGNDEYDDDGAERDRSWAARLWARLVAPPPADGYRRRRRLALAELLAHPPACPRTEHYARVVASYSHFRPSSSLPSRLISEVRVRGLARALAVGAAGGNRLLDPDDARWGEALLRSLAQTKGDPKTAAQAEALWRKMVAQGSLDAEGAVRCGAYVMTTYANCWRMPEFGKRAEALLWEVLELAEQIDTGLPETHNGHSCFDGSERFGAMKEGPVVREGLPSRNDLINIAMVAYSHTRGADIHYLTSMERIMKSMSTPDRNTYNVLVNAYGHSHTAEYIGHAEKILIQMEKAFLHGNKLLYPTTLTYNNVLYGLKTKSGGLVERDQPLHTAQKHVRENSNSTPLSRAQRRRTAVQAEMMLDRMAVQRRAGNGGALPDIHTFTLLIFCWSNVGTPEAGERAEALLGRMESQYAAGNESVRPDVGVYVNIVSCWARSRAPGCSRRAAALLSRLEHQYRAGHTDLAPIVPLYSAVIHACSQERNVARNGAGALATAFDCYNRMVEGGLRPNNITYSSLLNCVANLLPPGANRDGPPDTRAHELAREVFAAACEQGQVSRVVLLMLSKASKELHKEYVALPEHSGHVEKDPENRKRPGHYYTRHDNFR